MASKAQGAARDVIYNVQILRAVAASAVVLAHIQSMFGIAGATGVTLSLGTSGVDLFFVISGFVMVYTTARRATAPLPFIARRFARIAPLYWSLTLAIFAVAMVLPSILATLSPTRGDLLLSMLFIPYRGVNGAMQPLLFVGWTLNYEMFFYAVFAVSLRAREPVRVVALCSAMIVAMVVVGLAMPSPLPLAHFYTSPIMLEFVMGMWIGIAFVRGLLIEWRTSAIVLVAALAFLVSARVLYPVGERGWWAGPPSAAIVYSVLCLEKRGAKVTNQFLQLLGAASYSLYLVHPFVVDVMAKLVSRLGLTGYALGLAALSLLAAIASGVCAIAVHLWFEKPVGDWLNRCVRAGGRSRRAPAETGTVEEGAG